MLSRVKEKLFVGVSLVLGVLPGFFLAVLAIGLLGYGIETVDVGLIAFGASAVVGYVGGLMGIFSNLEFRTRHNAWILLLVSVGTVTLVTTIPTVISIATHGGRSWPAVMVFSTLICAISILVRQLETSEIWKSDRPVS